MTKFHSKDLIKDLIDDLENRFSKEIGFLEDMIDITEDSYGLISQRLPQIEENIDDTIEETELLINYFVDTEETFLEDDRGFNIVEVLDDLQEKIEGIYDSLLARDQISKVLAGFIEGGKGEEQVQFSQVLDLIEELEEVLISLKDLSINAIIVSAKVGKKGAGFRVISDKINNLANEIQLEYESIENNILNLKEWHDNFIDTLEKLTEMEESVACEYRKEIKEIFNKVLDSLQTVSDMLKNFMENIQWAVEPVQEIMVLTQNQDIIRQNLENLISIMKKTKAEIAGLNIQEMSREKLLNRVVFINETANLSQKLMNNILTQLEDSLFAIQDKFTEINDKLGEVEQDGGELITFLAGNKENSFQTKEEEKDITVELIYQELLDFIPDLTSKLEKLKEQYNHLLTRDEVFYSNMGDIENKFTEIESVASQFNKIKLLAKIEFSRIPDTKKAFDKEIEKAVENFIKSSEDNHGLYKNLKEKLEENYEQFVKLSKENKSNLTQANEIIVESKDKLLLTKKLIKEAIQALQKSIEELTLEVEKVKDQLGKCNDLQQQGREVVEFLAELEAESLQVKEKYLAELNFDTWEEKNERLNELINEFTSYLERKTAQEEVEDLEIDVGSEGGELTLF